MEAVPQARSGPVLPTQSADIALTATRAIATPWGSVGQLFTRQDELQTGSGLGQYCLSLTIRISATDAAGRGVGGGALQAGEPWALIYFRVSLSQEHAPAGRGCAIGGNRSQKALDPSPAIL
jgi:hypothetical protein